MGKEEIDRKVTFRMLQRVIGMANGMNGDVFYVGGRYHASWIDHAEKVVVYANSTVSRYVKGRGAGD